LTPQMKDTLSSVVYNIGQTSSKRVILAGDCRKRLLAFPTEYRSLHLVTFPLTVYSANRMINVANLQILGLFAFIEMQAIERANLKVWSVIIDLDAFLCSISPVKKIARNNGCFQKTKWLSWPIRESSDDTPNVIFYKISQDRFPQQLFSYH